MRTPRLRGMQPPLKRQRASGGHETAYDCDSSGSGDSGSSGGGDASGNGGEDKRGAVSLDFFADLDDWLEVAGDALLLPSSELPLEANAADNLAVGDGRSSREPSIPAIPPPTPVNHGLSPHLTPGVECAPSTRPKPKSSTQRQKEELAYLRGKVSELKVQLEQLRRDRWRQARDCAAHGSSDGRGARSDPSNGTPGAEERLGRTRSAKLWENIAKNQQEAATKAKNEREQLRARLKAQIKLTRSLEQLLCKPQVWDKLQKPHWRKGVVQSRTDADIFGDLLRSVEARYSLHESILGANDLEQHCKAASDIKLHYASVDGICVECRHANVLPFDFSLTCEVFWKSLLDGKIGAFDCPSTIVEHSADVILVKSIVERPPILSKPVTAYRVVKRVVSADCIRLVVELAVSVTEAPGSGIPPLQVIHQGWARLSPVKLDDGTAGTALQAFASSVLTILKPESALDSGLEDDARHREIDILSELIMSAYHEKQALARRELESALLDAALSRRSQRTQ